MSKATFNEQGQFYTLSAPDGNEVHISADGREVQIGDDLRTFSIEQVRVLVTLYPALAELVAQQRL